jgi:hypothetical protein
MPCFNQAVWTEQQQKKSTPNTDNPEKKPPCSEALIRTIRRPFSNQTSAAHKALQTMICPLSPHFPRWKPPLTQDNIKMGDLQVEFQPVRDTFRSVLQS